MAARGNNNRKPQRGPSAGRSGATGAGRGRAQTGANRGASGSGRPGASGPPRRAARGGAPGRVSGTPIPRQPKPKGLGGSQVEGRQAVRELLLAGTRRVHAVLLAEDLDPAPILDDIVELAGELRVPVRELSRAQLDEQSHTEAAQGVIARADELPEADFIELARTGRDGEAPFLLALDGVTDPGNLGALLRTAEGAGVTGVILPRHRSVHVTPTVTKTAAGAVEHVPMTLVGGLPAALTHLREAGVWVYGLDADGEMGLFDLPITNDPVCLVMGAEGRGLSRLVRERCDAIVSIPLRGALGSLNVSVSGGLACYEIVRRRVGSAGR